MVYRSVVRPLLFRLSAEQAHATAMTGLCCSLGLPLVRSLARSWQVSGDQRLRQQLWGLDFEHPVGLAAGFDKNAAYLAPLAAMGFSHVEGGNDHRSGPTRQPDAALVPLGAG